MPDESTQKMEFKILLADLYQRLGNQLWEYRKNYYSQLTKKQRQNLKDSRMILFLRAEETLLDALEEGIGGSADLAKKLNKAEEDLAKVCKVVGNVEKALEIIAKVLEISVAVISVGVPEASKLAKTLLG